MAIPYPFGLSSVLMTKTRTQGASFMQYQPRSGAAYTKYASADNPVFFNVTFRFRQVDAQRFWAWFSGSLQQGRLPFTIPMRTEFGLANQEVRFYAAQGDTILDHSQEGSVQLNVKLENETVWLSANQMAMLFDRDAKTIRKHINNVFNNISNFFSILNSIFNS